MATNRSDNNSQNRPYMEELTWEQARVDVMRVNPEFAEVIDELNPSKEYKLFKVRYPYGSEILKHGEFYIPNVKGEIVELNDISISAHIKEALSYNLQSNPVGIVLQNSIELFLPLEDRTIPFYGLIPPKKIFGTWRLLNLGASQQPKFIWNMTAGARSLFMLPKISETEKHNKLKKIFGISPDTPKGLMDHWQIFKEIANHHNFPETWFVEILFFSKEWFEHLNDKSWISLHRYLLDTAWKGNEFWRNQYILDLVFSMIQKNKDLKPSPYIADTVKYLFAIGIGSLPGFSPAIDNSVAPIVGLQKVYLDVYNIKYPPVIMQPAIFSMNDTNSRSVYYSLQFPTAIEFSPKTRNRTSVISDLYETKSLLKKYLTEISTGKFKIEETPLHELIKKVKYEFFHNNVGFYHEIRESKEIPFEDSSFRSALVSNENKEFPETSTFVKGCIRISHQ